MRFLTTNSSGKDTFGGIHTRLREHMKYSPEHNFYIIELNEEKKYTPTENGAIFTLDIPNLLNGDTIYGALDKSMTFPEFNEKIEPIVNEYQNSIQTVNPDIITIPGSSLTSYCLYKAAKRENKLDKTIHNYAGILEKEIGGYRGEPRAILSMIGKIFTSPEPLSKVTYIFPSTLTKETIEKEHNVKFTNYHIIPNGISEEFTNNQIERISPEELTLGYVGRIHHVKNPRYFLDLSDNLKEKTILKIITDLRNVHNKTDGPSLLDKLTKGEILYYHPRNAEKLNKFYRTQISSLVIPSSFETYCNVAMESIACGTPALLTNRAGATETYQKYGLDDLIFSITNLDSFETALESIKEREYVIEEKLKKQIQTDLSWEKIIQKYNEIAKNIL
tara:strand:- start:15 stop:1184 length:1170 start_codon:yes stop_codon:yes gene_type:complete